ncbi:MAG: hypothetical protein HY673_09855 [Chloroflexi bacterium]|nr:hypothetical protein [Chloroflexota bacterium]
MKIGILESKQDPFIQDVAARLGDFELDFPSFNAQQVPVRGDWVAIIDRISFSNTYLREIVKNLSLGGAYVLNNPFAAFATNKLVELKICQALGISYPRSVLLPNQFWREDLGEIVREPDFDAVVSHVGLPCVVKPFDGYGWENVFFISSLPELKDIYQTKKQDHVLLVQEQIRYVDYYRAFCINKRDVLFIKWVPRPFAMGQYLVSDLKPIESQLGALTQQTTVLNAVLDLDVNAVEWCIDETGKTWMIEAFNEVPDIDKKSIPEPYYAWIVEKFANCVIDKAVTRARNKSIFTL